MTKERVSSFQKTKKKKRGQACELRGKIDRTPLVFKRKAIRGTAGGEKPPAKIPKLQLRSEKI